MRNFFDQYSSRRTGSLTRWPYPSQRAHPIDDAQMKFKLETSLAKRAGAVKRQPEWAALLLQLLKDKRSNIQFQYVANMPWGTAGLDSRDSLAMIAGAWAAMEPLVDVLRGSE